MTASRSSCRDPAAEVTCEPVSGAPGSPVGGSLWTPSSGRTACPSHTSVSRSPPWCACHREHAVGSKQDSCAQARMGSRPRRKLPVKGSFPVAFYFETMKQLQGYCCCGSPGTPGSLLSAPLCSLPVVRAHAVPGSLADVPVPLSRLPAAQPVACDVLPGVSWEHSIPFQGRHPVTRDQLTNSVLASHQLR